LERRRALEVGDLRLTSALDGRRGVLALTGKIVLLGGASLDSASLVVVRHGRRCSVPLNIAPGAEVIRGKVEVPDVEAWWPHTHGEPALYEVRLEFTVAASDGTQSEVVLDLGRVGFRTVFDSGGGWYFSYKRVRLSGQAYEVVMERPAYDQAGTISGIGFAPCGSNAAIKYYVPVDC